MRATTLAGVLSADGRYETAFFGKWHVGGDGWGSQNGMRAISPPHH